MALSIEEKYDEVRQLINVGKEKGYLLYDEVNEMLPSEITSSEDLDDLFNAFGSAGIEVVDSDKAYRGDKEFDREGSGDEPELDLTPGALDKTNDPVRMYLREMGTVPSSPGKAKSQSPSASSEASSPSSNRFPAPPPLPSAS
jgi:RNA polymerase primary sigma factor